MVIAIALVVADWSARTVDAYHHGITTPDSLWYHLPFAARFVQEGWITHLHYVDAEPVTVFYPASSELFHSLGMLLMGNDLFSPVLNALWLGIALLAAWCIGSPFGVAPVTVTASAALFGTPGLVATQPGGGYDDIVGLALLLAAVAFLVNLDDARQREAMVCFGAAALAVGLALGTKYTFIGVAVALTAGAWFLAPGTKKPRAMGVWIGLILLTGGFWYGRNAIAVGNPLPSLRLFGLPSPPSTTPTASVSHFLFNTSAWSNFFLPGLRLSFGPAWWALLAMSVAGLVMAVLAGGRLRVLGLVGVATAIIFVFTPQYLTVLGAPFYFVNNVRYADDAIVLGLVLLPISPPIVRWSVARWVLAANLVVLAATQLDPTLWPLTILTKRFAPPVSDTDSVIGLVIGFVVLAAGTTIVLLHRSSDPVRVRSSTGSADTSSPLGVSSRPRAPPGYRKSWSAQQHWSR